MSTQNTNNLQDSDAGNDKNIDVTRSENRQAANDASAAGNITDNHEGTGAERGSSHPQNMSHTGSHQEGEYDKDHDHSSTEEEAGKPE